jgi:hypothetical protein
MVYTAFFIVLFYVQISCTLHKVNEVKKMGSDVCVYVCSMYNLLNDRTKFSEIWYWCRGGASLYLLYLLLPFSRVLLEKLTVAQLVKEFSAFHGTLRFIVFTTAYLWIAL